METRPRATADDSATGARDAAVWLAAARIHRESGDAVTFFISSNTRDFAESGDQRALRAELLPDLGDRISSFHYLPSLGAALEMLAGETVNPLPPDESLLVATAVGAEACIEELVRATWPSGDAPLDLRLEFAASRETHAYFVERTRIGRMTVVVRVTGGGDDGQTMQGEARLWYQQPEEGSGSSDCESFRWR